MGELCFSILLFSVGTIHELGTSAFGDHISFYRCWF